MSMRRTVATMLVLATLAACSAPPKQHPGGELYLAPPAVPRVMPSNDNDPNGGAN